MSTTIKQNGNQQQQLQISHSLYPNRPSRWRNVLEAGEATLRARGMQPAVAILAVLSAQAHAGGGATGGATEMTQMMNNTELVAQVGESVQTTSNTLMTAQSTMQMLRQLPASVINEQMGGLPIEKVQAMADAYRVMSQATNVYRDAENVLRKATSDAQRLGITPSELLRLKADAAQKHGGVYKQTYEDEQAKIKRLAETSKDVQRQAEIVKGIDSNVGGIQTLASQNLKVQASLADISDSVAKATALAAEEGQRERDAAGRVAEEAAELEAIRRKNARTPDAALRMPWEQIKK